jgi:coenzyme F420-reducing hydrogenase alpha subunit
MMSTTGMRNGRRRRLAAPGPAKTKALPTRRSGSRKRPSVAADEMATSPSVRQLAHDLANALGGARLHVALIRTGGDSSRLDVNNLDALERLLNQACDIEEALHAQIRRQYPQGGRVAADKPALKSKPARAGRVR